jgi:hypothetical protein
MTWLHIYDLLRAQDRFFPHGDIRPFAPLPPDWAQIEAMFRKEESQSRPAVETAIFEFINRGSWPPKISGRHRVFIRGRLDFACDTALRLAVPISDEIVALPKPAHISDDDTFNWLLIIQWEALGFDTWILDLRNLFHNVHRKKAPFESFPLPRRIRPDDPSSFFSKN